MTYPMVLQGGEEMLNILVLEDNSSELDYLCDTINSILKECCLLKAKSGEEALVLMTQDQIDIFFIDVELPGMNGFQFAEQIRKNRDYILTYIVFITGYKANQLSIHKKYHHYEYIEKPYTVDSFEKAVGDLLRELDIQKERGKLKHPADNRKKMILLELREERILVDIDEILYFETEGRNLRVHTKQKSIPDISMTLEDVIHAANCSTIVRCHKSYAINVKNVRSIKNIDRRLWHAYFNDQSDSFCQISKTYHNNVSELFSQNQGR